MWYVFVWIYGVLRYLNSIAVLTTTMEQNSQFALVQKSIPRSFILALLHSRQTALWLHNLCLEVLTVHGNEALMFRANAFPLLVLLIPHIWHSSSKYNFLRLSLAMSRFGQASRSNFKHQGRPSSTRTTVPQPSIKPITFRAERMRFMLCHERG